MNGIEIRVDSENKIVIPDIERFRDKQTLVLVDLIKLDNYISIYTCEEMQRLENEIKNRNDLSYNNKKKLMRVVFSSASEVDVERDEDLKLKIKLPRKMVDNKIFEKKLMCVITENYVRLYVPSKLDEFNNNLDTSNGRSR